MAKANCNNAKSSLLHGNGWEVSKSSVRGKFQSKENTVTTTGSVHTVGIYQYFISCFLDL